jgi:hypothetical protein
MANNNKNFQNLLAALQEEEKIAKEKTEKRNAANIQSREDSIKEFIEDTTLSVVKGYGGCLAVTSINVGDGELTPVSIVNNGRSNQCNTIAGIALALKNFLDAGNKKKKLTIYAYESEVFRASGFIKKIKEGSDEVLSAKEEEIINKYANVYGSEYINICTKLFGYLIKAKELGVTIKLVATNTLAGIPVEDKKLPLTLAGNKVFFRNGVARHEGHYIKLRNSQLNGWRTLKNDKGELKAERLIDITSEEAMEKQPEAFWANKLYTRISNAINNEINTETTSEEIAA